SVGHYCKNEGELMIIVAKALFLVAVFIFSVETTNIVLDSSEIIAKSEYGQWRQAQSEKDDG
ncbi:MAG: hypothetical protein ACRC62_17205, partial [Microcoleus sp.]